MSQTHTAVMSTTPPQSKADVTPAQGHLYVRPNSGPAEVRFMFEQQEKRLGGAMGARGARRGNRRIEGRETTTTTVTESPPRVLSRQA